MLKVNNRIFDYKSEHIYLYCWLQYIRQKVHYKTVTSVAFLSEEITFVKWEKDNRAVITQSLTDLHQAELIKITPSEFSASTRLEITFNGLAELQKNYTGKISEELLQLTPRQFHAVLYIKKWEKVKGKLIPLSEFAEQMKCSMNTAQKTLDELEELKIITITRGKYKTLKDGRLMQGVNKYKIQPWEYWFKNDWEIIDIKAQKQGII